MLKTALVALAAVLSVQATHAQGARYFRGDTVRLVARRMVSRIRIRASSPSLVIASTLISPRSL
jgi:hypothetical protein